MVPLIELEPPKLAKVPTGRLNLMPAVSVIVRDAVVAVIALTVDEEVSVEDDPYVTLLPEPGGGVELADAARIVGNTLCAWSRADR